jgi:hypothetical protein
MPTAGLEKTLSNPLTARPIAIYQQALSDALGGGLRRELVAIWDKKVTRVALHHDGQEWSQHRMIMATGFGSSIRGFFEGRMGSREDCQKQLRRIDECAEGWLCRNVLISREYDYVGLGFDWCESRHAFWALLKKYRGRVENVGISPERLSHTSREDIFLVKDLFEEWVKECV